MEFSEQLTKEPVTPAKAAIVCTHLFESFQRVD